ncbi:MAG: alpha-amylase [Bacteroidetes bacterium]|nr:alpha-amylase [Bacteroidota bacterium]
MIFAIPSNKIFYRSLSVLVISIYILACNKDAKQNLLDLNDTGLPYSVITLMPDSTVINIGEFLIDSLIGQSLTVDCNAPCSFKVVGNRFTMKYDNDSIPYIFLLKIKTQYTSRALLCKKSELKTVELTFNPANNIYKEVKVKGEFNSWNADATILDLSNGVYKARITAPPGSYQYKLMLDGKESSHVGNADSVSNGMGGWNNLLIVPKADESALPRLHTLAIKDGKVIIGKTANAATVIALWQNQEVATSSSSESIEILIPQEATKLERSFLRVIACNALGSSNDIWIPLQNGKVIEDAALLKRSDKHLNNMYFVLVDRFVDGDTSNTLKTNDARIMEKANYYGGDLQGIVRKLRDGYFDKLGINCIWISPIVQNPLGAYQEYPAPNRWFSGYHGYWPVHETIIDFRFGNDAVFKTLVDEAHKRNINVLLDFVSNHVHAENLLFKEHPEYFTQLELADGRKNLRLWDEQRLTTWFEPFMPDINYEKAEVVNLMSDSAMYWIKKFGIDGFRHDAVKHVPSPFWLTLTQKIKAYSSKSGNEIYQIGETFGSRELIRSYVSSGQLDGQFDFNIYFDASRILLSDESFANLKNSVLSSLSAFGHHHLMGNISGNHDMPRFVSFAGGALKSNEDAKEAGWSRNITVADTTGYHKLLQLHVLNMMLPGVPCTYYGDEYGDAGAGDPDNRRMARFGDDLNSNESLLLDQFSKISHLRNQQMALLYGELNFTEAGDSVLIMERNYFGKKVIAFFNKSDKLVKRKVDTNGRKLLFRSDSKLNNEIEIPPHGVEVVY